MILDFLFPSCAKIYKSFCHRYAHSEGFPTPVLSNYWYSRCTKNDLGTCLLLHLQHWSSICSPPSSANSSNAICSRYVRCRGAVHTWQNTLLFLSLLSESMPILYTNLDSLRSKLSTDSPFFFDKLFIYDHKSMPNFDALMVRSNTDILSASFADSGISYSQVLPALKRTLFLSFRGGWSPHGSHLVAVSVYSKQAT